MNYKKIGSFLEHDTKYIVYVRKELEKLKMNKQPYFALTGKVMEVTSDGKRHTISWGCIHDDIMKCRPDYKDLIAIHLSNMEGVPLYALANGYYFLQHPDTYPKETVARHFRIAVEEVETLRNMSRDELKVWIDAQYPRWKQEADTIIKKYNLKIVEG